MAERIRSWPGSRGTRIRGALGATTLVGVVLLGAVGGVMTVGVRGTAGAEADLESLVQGNTAFALDLYRAIRASPDATGPNLFFSPYSISLGLAMTYAGARGETERQMAEALRFTLPQDQLHLAFSRLNLALAGRTGLELSIASSLWGQTGHPFLPTFLRLLDEVYGAPLRGVDFTANPEAARKTINDWVEEETRGKIKDLIPPGGITTLITLVLANAIYFKAAWLCPFPEEATRAAPFYLLDGSQVPVPMMSQLASQRVEWLGYAAGEGWQAVELPYVGKEVSLVILLPDLGRFEEFERALDGGYLTSILGRIKREDIRLTMPKFTFTSRFNLKGALVALGMADAFSYERADFSRMDGLRDLFIGEVYHQAFVAVDEAGTEAAAATAVVFVKGAILREVKVDRPFLFLVHDRETGAILFLGRVLDPRQ